MIHTFEENYHAAQYLKLRDFIPKERLTENREIFSQLSINENAWMFLENFLEEKTDSDISLRMNWIDWEVLSGNESMIPLLEKYPEKICWKNLSRNKNAMRLLEKNPDKIFWKNLCYNVNAMPLIEKNKDKIVDHWKHLSYNPQAIPFLEKNMHRIDWKNLSRNENAIHLMEDNIDLIFWKGLHINLHGLFILEKYPDKIDWPFLSYNMNAIPLLEKNPEKICWEYISLNPMAVHIIEKNLDKVCWYNVMANARAGNIIESYLQMIPPQANQRASQKEEWENNGASGGIICDMNLKKWRRLATNPDIFTLDYEAIRTRMNICKDELIAAAMHPDRMRILFDLLEKNGEPISSMEKYI